MEFLKDFEVFEILGENSVSITYRGRRVSDDFPLVLTIPRSPAGDQNLREEFDLTRKLDSDSSHRPMELIDTGRGLLLLRRDLPEFPLNRFLENQIPGIPDFLLIAYQLAGALEEIHNKNVIHGNLTPENIYLNPSDFQIALTGFSRVRNLKGNDAIPGSLIYIAPEQTGRVNVTPDRRLDYYSLGIIFYEMLAGSPPFVSERPGELLHAHIAVKPPSLNELPVAPGLGNIVARLLAKAPADRYQSAFALKKDLERCRVELEATGRVPEFPVGRHDARATFQVPSRLYGREDFLLSLHKSYRRCEQGNRAIVIIKGESGSGKTALFDEFRRRLPPGDSLFGSGKYEINNSAPVQGITRVLRELLRSILTLGEPEMAIWRKRLSELFLDYGYIFARSIPELSRLVAIEEPIEEPGPAERENRFLWVMQRLPGIFASQSRPLILFLDDIQWADPTSVKVLRLWTNPDNRWFLLVIAFREGSETSASAPVEFLEEANRLPATTILQFGPLDENETQELIRDTISLSADELPSFSRICLRKTGGNPFFLLQFLRSLYEDGLLRFDSRSECWRWDEKEIRNSAIPEDTARWLVTRLERLPPEILQILKHASCAGHSFQAITLSGLADRGDILESRLDFATRVGFLIRSEGGYRFAHDRVQEAVGAILTEEEKVNIHYRMGISGLKSPAQEGVEDLSYATLHHLMIGFEHLRNSLFRRLFIELCLRELPEMKRSLAYEKSLICIKRAMELLEGNAREEDPELYFKLCQARMEVEFLNENDEQGEFYFRILADRALSPQATASLFSLKINLYNHRMKSRAALETGSEALKALGLNVSFKPIIAPVWELLKAKFRLHNRSMNELENLSPMTDQKKIAAVKILMLMIPAGHILRPELGAYLGLRMLNVTLRYGNAPASYFAYAMYGVTLALVLKDFDSAYQFAQLSIRLAGKRKEEVASLPDPNFGMGVFISYWKEPLKNSLDYFQRGLTISLNRADTVFAAYNAIVRVDILILLGLPLRRIEEIVNESRLLSHKLKNRQLELSVAVLQIWLAVLRDGLEPGAESPELHLYIIEDQKNAALFSLVTLHHSFLMERNDIAWHMMERLESLPDLARAGFHFIEHRLFRILILLRSFDRADDLEKKRRLKIVRADLKQLYRWTSVNEGNFLHRALLADAEFCRVTGRHERAGRLYEKAVQSADEYGFVQNAALALELAGKYHLSRETIRVAGACFREAARRYAAWGAFAKARTLADSYAELFRPETKIDAMISPLRSLDIDLDTLLESFLVITQEIDLEKLLADLIRYLMENAGGDFAALLLEKDGGWKVEAEANANDPNPSILQSISPDAHSVISPGVVSYVVRSLNQTLLNHPAEQGLFVSEPVIQERKPASLLCVPLIRQGKLAGILYMENSFTTEAFVGERIALLNMLSAQMAGAIENARLYQDTLDLNWRIRTLLEATRSMSEARDTPGALSIATGYILNALKLSRSADHLAYLPDLDQEGEFLPRPIFPEEQSGPPGVSGGKLPKSIHGICIRNQILFLPVVHQGSHETVLALANVTHEPGPELMQFLAGITDSLGLVLNNLRKQDQEKLAIVGRLASEIVHDIKNHVALIQERSRRLRQGSAPRQHLKAIDTETTLLSQMAGDILDFTGDGFLIRKQECLPEDFVADLRESIGSYLEERNVSLEIETVSVDRLQLDRERFKRVLINLAKNGVEAMGEGGVLFLRVEKEGELVYISLRDTGPGIPEEIRERVFEPFISHGKKGTGLGLTVARRIVRAHGGEISAENNPKGGACFRIVLPVGEMEGS